MAIFTPGIALIVTVAPVMKKSGQMGLDIVYMVTLMTSLWMAWGVLIRSFYPRLNAWMIAIGMSFFFVCDVGLGLKHIYQDEDSMLSALFGLLPDLTYSNALLLLALSGFVWRGALSDRTSG